MLRSRETTATIIFEKFDVPALHIASTANLTLYAAGQSTGIVVDSSFERTQFVPISDNVVDKETIRETEFGGRHLDAYLQQVWKQTNVDLPVDLDLETVRNIKESLCYVALDVESETASKDLSTSYKLPDGSSITIEPERIVAPEGLFNPNKAGIEELGAGIHEVLYWLLLRYKGSGKEELLSRNIVLVNLTSLSHSIRGSGSRDIGSNIIFRLVDQHCLQALMIA